MSVNNTHPYLPISKIKLKPEVYEKLLVGFDEATLRFNLDMLMQRGKDRMMKVYFSFPYSDNPQARVRAVKWFMREILSIRTDVIPIVPHLMFDTIYDYPRGYTHEEMGVWEVHMIHDCDVFCFWENQQSQGVRWEKAIATAFRKPIITFDALKKGWKQREEMP